MKNIVVVIFCSFLCKYCSIKDDNIFINEVQFNKIVSNNEMYPCKYNKMIFTCDTNIYISNRYTTSIYKFDSLWYCFSEKIVVYGNIIDIDSIYVNNMEDKEDVIFLAKKINASYSKSRDTITMKLCYYNGRLNSSSSSIHEYTIEYDKCENRINKINFKWTEDCLPSSISATEN